jgi:hypothetical protein
MDGAAAKERAPHTPAWTPQASFPAAYAASAMVAHPPQYASMSVAAMPMCQDYSSAVGCYFDPTYYSAMSGPTGAQARMAWRRMHAVLTHPPAEDLVHYEQQIPHSLVGLVIGVKGASIHAVVRALGVNMACDHAG